MVISPHKLGNNRKKIREYEAKYSTSKIILLVPRINKLYIDNLGYNYSKYEFKYVHLNFPMTNLVALQFDDKTDKQNPQTWIIPAISVTIVFPSTPLLPGNHLIL